MNLNDFNIKRDKITNIYSEIINIAVELDAIDTKEVLQNLSRDLKSDSFNMVVVGEFSRGKSTFINALLGTRVLPSATKPTTTVINKISYGENEKYTLYFRDNREPKVISKEEFTSITAKVDPDFDDKEEVRVFNENLKLVSEVAYANISYSADICKNGIDIVDTPGTNDLDQAREEITFNFIPKSDAAILLLSANQILSESELLFLKERILDNDIKKVFFVINFKDRLNSVEDEEKVIEYAKEHLKEVVNEPRVYMLSAKGALNYKRRKNGEEFKGKVPSTFEETGFPEFEKEITDYLVTEKGKDKLKKYIDKGIKVSKSLDKDRIELSIASIGLDVKTLERQINDFLPKLNNTKYDSKKKIDKMEIDLLRLENSLVSKYKNGLEKIAFNANSVINNYNGELDETIIARLIEGAVAPEQKKLEYEIQRYRDEAIQNTINTNMESLKSTWADLEVNTTKALNVVKNNVGIINTKVDISTDCQENNDLDTLGGILAGGAIFALFTLPHIVIPAMIFGGKKFSNMFQMQKRQNILNQIKDQVEKRYLDIIPTQVEAFKKEYKNTTNNITKLLNNEVDNRIRSLEEQLNNLLREKKNATMNDERKMTYLLSMRKKLNELNMQLEGIL